MMTNREVLERKMRGNAKELEKTESEMRGLMRRYEMLRVWKENRLEERARLQAALDTIREPVESMGAGCAGQVV